MDKFGIFNLLSSLFNQENQNPTQKNQQTTENPLSNNFQEKENTNKKNTENLKNNFVPLQTKMINTINSHDLFIKRVMQNNKKSNHD